MCTRPIKTEKSYYIKVSFRKFVDLAKMSTQYASLFIVMLLSKVFAILLVQEVTNLNIKIFRVCHIPNDLRQAPNDVVC